MINLDFLAQAVPITQQEETPTPTTEDERSSGEKIIDAINGAIEENEEGETGIGRAIDGILSPIDSLNEASAELANTAFQGLAETGIDLTNQNQIELGPFSVTLSIVAGFVAFAAILVSIVVIAVSPFTKTRERFAHLGGGTLKFLVISSVGTAIGVAMAEGSARLTAEAVALTLPETIDTTGANLYDSGLAVIAVPLVGVSFKFQAFLVAALIAAWPLAAAVSIVKAYEKVLNVVTALFVVNIVWPPMGAAIVGQAFSVLPDVASASWWCVGVPIMAVIANGVAVAAAKI